VCTEPGWELLSTTVVLSPKQYTHTHTPQVQNMPSNTDHALNKHM
jgi:hypothetical protein